MSIIFDESKKMFLLQAKDTSYAMQVSESGYLCHVYWGKKVYNLYPENIVRKINHSMSPNTDGRDTAFFWTTFKWELVPGMRCQ